MSSKYKGNLKKGDLVYTIRQYGINRGQPDYSRLYKIRSIGVKQAIVDFVDESGNTNMAHRRGTAHYLIPREEAERRESLNYYGHSPWCWGQVFLPRGSEGWDPNFNI